MPQGLMTPCDLCKLHTIGPNGRGVCEAFPGGIPDEVEYGEVDHRYPHPEDNGIQFVPDDDVTPEDLALLDEHMQQDR